MKRRSSLLAAAGLGLAAVALAVPSSQAAGSGGYNDPACQPSAEHPRPVVLLHGTSASAKDFDGLGPKLAAEGYCAFAQDYGKDPKRPAGANGNRDVDDSLQEISSQIDAVLARAGAQEVNLVGHSQGGLLAEAYAKAHPDRVRSAVLLAPPTHGTNLGGVVSSRERTPLIRRWADELLSWSCPACVDMETDSDFVRQLNAGGVTVPGVRYAVLATEQDATVTPAGSASYILEPGVVNRSVQGMFDGKGVSHADLPKDEQVQQWVVEAFKGLGS